MLTKLRTIGFIGGLLAAASFVAAPALAEAPESDDPIKIALNNWSSQYVSSYIIGGVLESMGYEVEYVQADAMAQFAGLETGDLTLQTEIWPTTQADRFRSSLDSGNLLDMGELGLRAKEEWWYPIYMKEQCPGLPDWHALLEEACAEAFSTAQTAPKGRYLGGPAVWEGFDDERVVSLGLPWEVIHAGSEATMWAELKSAYLRKAPTMQWVWVPHWWPSKYEGEFVEFPKYTDECYNDASWGVNPDMKYDCGKPEGMMHKAAWAGGEAKWPAAYAMFRNYSMDLNTYAGLISAADIGGREADEIAAEWLANNSERWQGWLPK